MDLVCVAVARSLHPSLFLPPFPWVQPTSGAFACDSRLTRYCLPFFVVSFFFRPRLDGPPAGKTTTITSTVSGDFPSFNNWAGTLNLATNSVIGFVSATVLNGATQTFSAPATAASMAGNIRFLSPGQLNLNLVVPSGRTMSITGAGATVSGPIVVNGALSLSGTGEPQHLMLL
jgi:hypothetical protein